MEIDVHLLTSKIVASNKMEKRPMFYFLRCHFVTDSVSTSFPDVFREGS